MDMHTYSRTYADCVRRGFAKLTNGDVIDHIEWSGGGVSVTRVCRPDNSRYWISSASGVGLPETFEKSAAAFAAAQKVLEMEAAGQIEIRISEGKIVAMSAG